MRFGLLQKVQLLLSHSTSALMMFLHFSYLKNVQSIVQNLANWVIIGCCLTLAYRTLFLWTGKYLLQKTQLKKIKRRQLF